jgi:AmiR/NasT family two-component response regulator
LQRVLRGIIPPVNQDRQRIEQLTEAVEHRTTIGKALGMLMERFDFTDDEAFQYLRQCSQAQNRKLYDIAVEFVETRALPEVRRRPRSA